MAQANKYCKYPVCRILYKTDNTPGWYMAEKSGSVEECQKICEEKKKSHTWTDYECRADCWYYNEIDIPLRKYEPEANDLHMRTLLIYNPDDKKYYYPDEIMPYPQKSLSRLSNKFCITAKTEPADDKDGLIDNLLGEYGIKTSSHYADRIMRISCAETYRIHHAREKELIAADTPRRYDTIDFRIQPAGTLEIPWADCNRVVILINGQEIENIVCEKEKEFFAACGLDVEGAGCYHCLWPSGLYEYLMDARLSHGKNKAPILCCTCDEVGCGSVKVCVEYTKDSVIWKNFESCRKEWNWGLEYEFEYEAYEEFMQRIKALSDNWQR